MPGKYYKGCSLKLFYCHFTAAFIHINQIHWVKNDPYFWNDIICHLSNGGDVTLRQISLALRFSFKLQTAHRPFPWLNPGASYIHCKIPQVINDFRTLIRCINESIYLSTVYVPNVLKLNWWVMHNQLLPVWLEPPTTFSARFGGSVMHWHCGIERALALRITFPRCKSIWSTFENTVDSELDNIQLKMLQIIT